MGKPLKDCPTCGKQHSKRGPYCCQSCGNSRKWTEEDKEKKRKKLLEYHDTPEGFATREKLKDHLRRRQKNYEARKNGEYILQPDDYAVEIPDFDDKEPIINW